MTLSFRPLERDASEGLYRHPREEEGLVSGSWLRRGNSGLGSDVRGREPCLEFRKVRGGQRAGAIRLRGEFTGSPGTGSRAGEGCVVNHQRTCRVHLMGMGSRDGATSILLWDLNALSASYLPWKMILQVLTQGHSVKSEATPEFLQLGTYGWLDVFGVGKHCFYPGHILGRG